MTVFRLKEGEKVYYANDFRTLYDRCDSITQFMYSNPVYRCIKKKGHSGLHKCISKNCFGVAVGEWNDEKIVKNLLVEPFIYVEPKYRH